MQEISLQHCSIGAFSFSDIPDTTLFRPVSMTCKRSLVQFPPKSFGRFTESNQFNQRPYIRETMHSALNLCCLSRHPLSQLLGGASVSSYYYQQGSIAVPPSSWDKGCQDKHQISNVEECIVSLYIRSLVQHPTTKRHLSYRLKRLSFCNTCTSYIIF